MGLGKIVRRTRLRLLARRSVQFRGGTNAPVADVRVFRLYRRLRNGRLPDALNELAPDFIDQLPGDRFRTEPLIDRQTDGGYLLYSVGMDKIDNRGRKQMDPVDAELAKSDPKLAKGHDFVLRIKYADQK